MARTVKDAKLDRGAGTQVEDRRRDILAHAGAGGTPPRLQKARPRQPRRVDCPALHRQVAGSTSGYLKTTLGRATTIRTPMAHVLYLRRCPEACPRAGRCQRPQAHAMPTVAEAMADYVAYPRVEKKTGNAAAQQPPCTSPRRSACPHRQADVEAVGGVA